MPQWINTTVGKVRIEKILAKGGMAEVYLGTHLTLERPVAVKVLHSFIEEDEEMKMRFEREARVVAALRHPNIVQIYDYDTLDGHPYLVMEYIRGPSLAAYLKNLHTSNERMQTPYVARLLGKIASALDYAHEQGVIHRDVKPGNILLHTKTGGSRSMFTDQIEPIITDFGLVRIMRATTQTASGLVSGTPAYISPEQAQGLSMDLRTDIYSLGVVLYEILAGRVPFEAETTWSVIYKHIHEPPPPILNAQPAIQKVIDRALAKNPDDRYQSCRDLAMDYMNAVGLIAEAATLQFPGQAVSTSPIPEGTQSTAEKQSQPSRRLLIPLLGAGLLILLLAAIGLPRLFSSNQGNEFPTAAQHVMSVVETPSQNADTEVIPPVEEAEPVGLLRFQDGTAPGDQITLSTSSIPLPQEGSQYEAWLIEDDGEQRVSVGFIVFDDEGKGSLTYVDPQGRNLIGMYHGLEITLEPDPDNNPIPSNEVVYLVMLPESGFTHARHVLYSFDATPNQVGFVQGLNTHTRLLQQLAQQMLESYQAGNEALLRSQAEEMVNAIVGDQSPEHKDWDNNGTMDDPGDGFGLLLNGENEGYIQGTFTHANLTQTSADATENMLVHGEHVKIVANNIAQWTPMLRDQLILILQTPLSPEMEDTVRNAVALANQIQDGIDVDGNENIEPIPDEGGATTAYEHAYYMADILIPATSDGTPVP
ncbi:MAG TPA: serine/threonine-protein kinase [Anaerolineales bacterium]|nr:serine/threonine-protein kinase [Anaerolineales bacterium]